MLRHLPVPIEAAEPAYGADHVRAEVGTLIGAGFADVKAADDAVARLLAAGYERQEISIITQHAACARVFDEPGDRIAGGAARGAAAGGTLGVLLAVAANVGGFLVAGPIGAIVGAATGMLGGALAGALVTAGMPPDDARHCEDEVSAGEIFVGAHTHGVDADRLRALLNPLPPVARSGG